MDRQFPPEIVQLIGVASLEPYDSFSFQHGIRPRRYATLKSYSFLNSTWRGISEQLLYRWVVLESDELALKFLETAEERGEIEGVRDLSVDPRRVLGSGNHVEDTQGYS